MKKDHASLIAKYKYNPKTGLFIYKNGPRRGKVAGHVHSNGYRYIRLDGKTYLAHRLAWYYVYGIWPSEIDHKNRNRDDNTLSNLRDVTHVQNMANHPGWKDKKKSKLPKGVYRYGDRFIVFININKHKKYLGIFISQKKAGRAYKAAARQHFGEHAA